jgi:hypothetical protein
MQSRAKLKLILGKKLKLTKNKKKIKKWARTKLKNKKEKKRGALVKWCVSPKKKWRAMDKRGGVSLERENIKLESERRKREFELRVMS